MQSKECKEWKRDFLTCLFNCLVKLQRIDASKDINLNEYPNGIEFILSVIDEVFIQHVPPELHIDKSSWRFYENKPEKLREFRLNKLDHPKWMIKYEELNDQLKKLKFDWNTSLLNLEKLLTEDFEYIQNPNKHIECISHLISDK